MTRASSSIARELLELGMTAHERRLNARLIGGMLRRFAGLRDQPADVSRALVEFLRGEIHELLNSLTALSARHLEFRRSYARVVDPEEANRMLLDYATELGASWWQRQGDRRALRRWFDDAGLHDRWLRRRGDRELELIFAFGRLGALADLLASQTDRARQIADLWQSLGIDLLVRDALQYSGDRRVRAAAMRCLATSLARVPPAAAGLLLDQSTAIAAQRLAMDPAAETWLQCAAIDVLRRVDPELAEQVLELRLMHPATGDDLFVRRHCLRAIPTDGRRLLNVNRLWEQLVRDPSPAVRQQLAATLWSLSPRFAWPWLTRLIEEDPCGQVRGAALYGVLDGGWRGEYHLRFVQLLTTRLTAEQEAFCQRVALHVAVELPRTALAIAKPRIADELRSFYARHLVPAIRRVQTTAHDVSGRRWAAAAAERLWVLLDPAANRLYTQLQPIVAGLPRGKSRRLPARLLRAADRDTFGRTLAVLTQDDYGIELVRGLWGHRLRRQPRFGFRAWRAWSEFWRPATDKRQAYRHTVGRVPQGNLRAPSRILGN